MADLFAKKEVEVFGRHTAEVASPSSLSTLHRNDPFSPQFDSRCHTAKDLARYLMAWHIKRYGLSLDLPPRAVVRHAKIVMEIYSVDVLARGIAFAAQVCNYPFSFSFVVDQAVPKVLKRCPFLQTYKDQPQPIPGGDTTNSVIK